MGEYSTGGAVVRPVIKQGTDGATLLLGADEALLRGTETILFVEDQSFVREVTGKILKSAGYRVLVAKSAVEASRAYDLASGEVELLLTDVILPRENGQELARELRRKNPLLRVLLITGYAEQMGKSETEQEFGRWLPKPFFCPHTVAKSAGSAGRSRSRSARRDLREGDVRECNPCHARL
jgi:CheY-like chemotaxis protein